ncbi:MAG: HAD family acid phosphatase [Candidatus Berkiellales bacterium]
MCIHQFVVMLVVSFFSALSLASVTHPSPTQNSAQLKEYYDSGKYFQAMEGKIREAKEYIDRQLIEPRLNRLAIIFDIDETALSNYRDLERLHFTHNTQALTAAYMMASAPAIPPILDLYQYALSKKISVFFISERPNTPEISMVTVKNLKLAGFDQWDDLILKPLDKQQSDQDFKTAARRHISLQGFDIIINVGDQETDLKGGFAEVKIKVPNPFYGA